jgi:hypothetical protein
MKLIMLLAFPFLITGNQKKITLNILISSKNNVFYYEDKLAQDGSNFKTSTFRDLISWSEYLAKNYSEVFYVLKVEQKDSLNAYSKKLIQHFEAQKHYKIDAIRIGEKTLIKATENAWVK